jgi:phage tail-like protein
MRLKSLTALPHVDGSRIDLRWSDPAQPPAVRVLRATGSHPTDIADGTEVTDVRQGPTDQFGTPTRVASDTGLQGETIYYYTVFTRLTGEADFTTDPHNRVSAMATASYGFGAQMFAMLPAVYHRYDAALTNRHVEPADRDKGVLRRFLDLTGGQMDQLYSLARAALDLHDLDRVEGALLPLLAQWIGWRTDYAAPVRTQRREIRHASEIYQRIGTVAALDATSRRVTGLRFRAKEFVHNIARTNEPERLNLWAVTRDAPGAAWSDPEVVSINHAFEGRPAYVPEPDGDLVFYHTRRRHGAAQQAPPTPSSGPVRVPEAAIHSWDVWAKKRAPDGTWSPSRPVVSGTGDDKHPAAARFADRLWLFWETYQARVPTARRRIAHMTRPAGEAAWSAIAVSGQPGAEFLGGTDTERRRPVTAVDDRGALWLFWQESTGDRWEIKYNRHDGNDWQLATPKTLPQNEESRIHDDLFVLVRPTPATGLYLFGARQSAGQGAGDTRWLITYRVKDTLDPDADDWQDPHTLPKPPGVHDREPAPASGADGGIELYFSTTRTADAAAPADGRWSVFGTELLDPAANTWAGATAVAVAAGSQRAPMAVRRAGVTVLVYRSSQPLSHTNALEDTAIDYSCIGTTTFRGTRAVTYGSFDDIQTYTYTARGGGSEKDGRISRESVGLFLIPSAEQAEPAEVRAAIARLRAIVGQYLPINTRAIFPVDQ